MPKRIWLLIYYDWGILVKKTCQQVFLASFPCVFVVIRVPTVQTCLKVPPL